MLSAFLYGAILALGLIIPLGAQNVFVFNQGATQKHYLHALPCVITAFFCDAILIVCAVLGVSVLVLTIPWLKTGIFIMGFLFLFYMGWMIWNSRIAAPKNGKPYSAKQQIYFALSVSLLNPHALIDTIGVIGTNSLHFSGADKFAYTIACIVVSFIWFFGLSVVGHFLNKLDSSNTSLIVINKVSALIMWAMGFYLVWQSAIFLHLVK